MNNLEKFLNPNDNKTKLIFLLSLFGIAVFLALVFTAPFQKKDLSQRYQKPPSFATGRPAAQPTFNFESLIGSKTGDLRYNLQYDYDKDGKITFSDYGHFLSGIPAIKNIKLESTESSKTLDFKGYIVEFKDEPLIKRQEGTQTPGPTTQRRGLSLSEPDSSFQSNHERAKNDVLSKLGRTRYQTHSTLSEGSISPSNETVQIMGDYSKAFNGIALNINENQAKEVKNSVYVKDVYPNLIVSTYLNESTRVIKANEVWDLDAPSSPEDPREKITGRGIKIAIIDSGVDYTHPDLGGCLGPTCKVIGGYDSVNNDSDPMDDNGHGTHVAAIAAGNGILKGVAPDAKILAYKVMGSDGSGFNSSILDGIEKSLGQADILNLSLGAYCGRYNQWCGPDDFISQVLDRVVDFGLTVIVAAGNSGPGESTIGSPGTARKVITVGASDKTDKVVNFSSRGPITTLSPNDFEIIKPNVVAPGFLICAARLATFEPWKKREIYSKCVDDNHVLLSGTSMASPHVAGLAALVKQAHPNWSSEQIKSNIASTAFNLGETYVNQGSGRTDALRSVQNQTLVTPASLNFTYLSSPTLTNLTKDLVLKNTGTETQNYSLTTKQDIPGLIITLSESNFALTVGETKTVQITVRTDISVNEQKISYNEIQVVGNNSRLTIPLAIINLYLEEIILDSPLTNKSLTAQVNTNALRSPPTLVLRSPSGVTTNISLSRSLIDPTVNVSSQIDLTEEGDHQLIASSPQIPNYQKSATIKRDTSKPDVNLQVTSLPDKSRVVINSNEEINEVFQKRFLDNHQSGYYGHVNPSLFVEGSNIYVVYRTITLENETTLTNKIIFQKSNDGGVSWRNPMVVASSDPELGGTFVPSLVKFNNKIFLAYLRTVPGRELMVINSSDEGASWSQPQVISGIDTIYPTERKFALKIGKGKMHIVYAAVNYPNYPTSNRESYDLRYLSSDGNSWSEPRSIAPLDNNFSYHRVDLDTNGDSLNVAYTTNYTVGFTSSSNGESWSSPKEISSAPNPNPEETRMTNPSILKLGGNFYVAWMTYDWNNITRFNINFAKSVDNGLNWTIKNNVVNDIRFGDYPKLVQANNKLYLTITDELNERINFRYSRDQGESWEGATNLRGKSLVQTDIATISDGGIIHFIWPSELLKSGNYRLVYSRDKNIILANLSGNQRAIIDVKKENNSWQGELSNLWSGLEVELMDLASNGSNSLTYNLDLGWNLIGLPLDPTPSLTASNILTKSGCQEVDRWYAAGWNGHVKDRPFNNFPIEGGKGYFIKCGSTDTRTSFTITGTPINNLPTLSNGWNLVALPFNSFYNSVVDFINAYPQETKSFIKEVDRWYAGGWNGYLNGLPFNKFPVAKNQGYFVKYLSSPIATVQSLSLPDQVTPALTPTPTVTSTPTPVPTPTSSPTPTPTSIGTIRPATTPATPSAQTSVSLPPAQTSAVNLTGTNSTPQNPDGVIVKYKEGQSPRDLQAGVSNRQNIRSQPLIGPLRIALEDVSLRIRNLPTPENKLNTINQANREANVVSTTEVFSPYPPLPGSTLDDVYLLKTSSPSLTENVVRTFRSLSEVEYTQPNYSRQPLEVPNDSYYSQMWNLKKIQMESAWDISKGSDQVIAAVVDTGVDSTHEDLPRERILMKDIPANSNFLYDYDGHGTHVSGIIGAMTNNNKGISGVNWNIKLLAVKVSRGSYSIMSDSDIASGIRYAADQGAKVINLSLGGTPGCVGNQLFIDTINYARSKGAVIVAAAGNNNSDASSIAPASCPGVVAVGAVGPDDQRAYYSNYGSLVDVAAPGGDPNKCGTAGASSCQIYSTTPGNNYSYKMGTSMATPHVSGMVALMFALNSSLTPDQVESILKDTGDNINTDRPIGKRLNAANVLGFVRSRDLSTPNPSSSVLPSYSPYPTNVSQQYPVLNTGWNLIGLPLNPSPSLNAQELLNKTGCGELDRWYAGGWSRHIRGRPFNNFAIEGGKGYFVKCGSSDTRTPFTLTDTPLNDLPTLSSGWNLVALPFNSSYTTVEDLVNAYPQVIKSQIKEVDRWYAGGWSGYINGRPFNKFPVSKDQGYFIRYGSSTTTQTLSVPDQTVTATSPSPTVTPTPTPAPTIAPSPTPTNTSTIRPATTPTPARSSVVNPTITSFSPITTQVNQTVTISGSSFGRRLGLSSVKFHNTQATILSWSDNRIQVRVPNGAVNGKITVRTANGMTVQSPTNFTLQATSVPQRIVNYFYYAPSALWFRRW